MARPSRARFDTYFAKGWAPTWSDMGHGNWATDPNYAGKVIGVYHSMVAFSRDGRLVERLHDEVGGGVEVAPCTGAVVLDVRRRSPAGSRRAPGTTGSAAW